MRKYGVLFLLLAMLMSVALLFSVGCDALDDDEDDQDSTETIPSGFVGTWTFQYSVLDNEVDVVSGVVMTLSIQSDGSWTHTYNSQVWQSGSSTFEIRGGVEHWRVVITSSQEPSDVGDSMDLTIRRGDSYLSMEYTDEDGLNHEVYTRNHSGTAGVNGLLFHANTFAPLAGVVVTATPASGSPATSTTDGYGFFSFETLPAGIVTLTASVSGMADLDQQLSALNNTTLFFPLGMLPSSSGSLASITGQVRDILSSEGIPGAMVISDDSRSANCDSEGRYTIQISAGHRTLTASANGYQSSATAVDVVAGQSGTLNFYLSEGSSNTGTVSGYVTDANTNDPLEFAEVTAATGEFDYASEDGYYFMTVPAGTVALTASYGDYTPQTQYITVAVGASVTANFQLVGGVAGTGTLFGLVTDSQTGDPIENVFVQTDMGESGLTDANGEYSFTSTSGNRTVSYVAGGYITVQDQFYVEADGSTEHNVVMSPQLTGTDGQLRFVLSWQLEPYDLDSYLLVPESLSDSPICYWNDGSSTEAPWATLDVDDTGSYGPETITVYQYAAGTYSYYVHNFSGSPDLAGCGARVDIYDVDGLVQTLHVPTSGTGEYWYVCDVDGTTGTITWVNQVQENEPGTVRFGKRSK